MCLLILAIGTGDYLLCKEVLDDIVDTSRQIQSDLREAMRDLKQSFDEHKASTARTLSDLSPRQPKVSPWRLLPPLIQPEPPLIQPSTLAAPRRDELLARDELWSSQSKDDLLVLPSSLSITSMCCRSRPVPLKKVYVPQDDAAAAPPRSNC